MIVDTQTASPAVVIVLECRDYHVARLRGAIEHSPVPTICLELSGRPAEASPYDWRTDDRAGVRIDTLFPDGSCQDLPGPTILRAVRRYLEDLCPSVVIVTGYSEFAMRVAARWALERNVPAVLMSSSTRMDRARIWPKERFKGRWLRQHFAAAFTSGARSADYLEWLGFDAARTWRGYGVVDNAAFAAAASTVAQRVPETGADSRPYFLYVGRLASEKNISLLLQAYRLHLDRESTAAWGLQVVGSGPLEARLKREAHALGLREVVWAGLRFGRELGALYAGAGALVLPSRSEPWGLVVNEAMACGLPVLASDRCGCVFDLVRPGINGYVFSHRDVRALSELMNRVTSGSVDLASMGKASARIISNYTPDTWGRSLADCIDFVRSHHRQVRS